MLKMDTINSEGGAEDIRDHARVLTWEIRDCAERQKKTFVCQEDSARRRKLEKELHVNGREHSKSKELLVNLKVQQYNTLYFLTYLRVHSSSQVINFRLRPWTSNSTRFTVQFFRGRRECRRDYFYKYYYKQIYCGR